MGMEILVNNLSFSYSDSEPEPKYVFQSMTSTFRNGRVSAVVGKSGSGKSTLLKLLAGLVGQDNQLKCISYGPNRISPREMAKCGRLSLGFQKPACLPWATVYDNVALPFRLQKRPTKQATILDLIGQFGLDKYCGAYPHTLSVGMQARVALARAFVTAPDVVLLDEPFSSLDVGWKEQLYNFLLSAQSDRQSTIVLVTHDLLEALCLADDIHVIGENSMCSKLVLVDNPMKQTGERSPFAALIANDRFPELFKDVHEAIEI